MAIFIPGSCDDPCTGETGGDCCDSDILYASGGNEGLDYSMCLHCLAISSGRKMCFDLDYEAYTIPDTFQVYATNQSGTENKIIDTGSVNGSGTASGCMLCLGGVRSVRLVVIGGGTGTLWTCTLSCYTLPC